MQEYLHLKNAPITEAIIDFRVKLHPDFQVKEFFSLKKELHEKYPTVRERKMIEGTLEIRDGKPIQTLPVDKGLYGYFFESNDGKNVAQFRKDGFTFSRLKPYTRWEEVIQEARTLWNKYVKISSPEYVTRIATRYINHLNIPLPIAGLSDYLASPPKIPDI